MKTNLIQLGVAAQLAVLTAGAGVVRGAAEAGVEPAITAWRSPSVASVEGKLQDWLGEAGVANAETQLARLDDEGDRLDAVLACLAAGSDQVDRLVAACNALPPVVESTEWLDSSDLPEFVRSNVRLYAGRALVRAGYYEQALALLERVELSEAADPAALLFYTAVAEHQLVQVDEARESLASLLGTDETLPLRFEQVARLMQSDLTRVEPDSLDHIARRMSDVRRRLGLGDAGDRTQEVEQGILASLDKLIEKAEQQQQQQMQQQQQPGGQPSGTPLEESQIAEQKGPGDVDIKDIGDQAGWGDLPPAQRERVLQQIGRDFPAHYRDLMEEYLKRLATDERETDAP